ncbi:MAG: hypothetical protein ACK6DF_09940 [Betaproteobacteria bacterium]
MPVSIPTLDETHMMHKSGTAPPPSRAQSRRALLERARAAGLFAAAAPPGWAQWFGRKPAPLPPGRSFWDLRGGVLIDGKRATLQSRLTGGDEVEVAKGGKAIFVVGTDAFLLRENSRLEMQGGNGAVTLLRLTTGALLSVFGRTPVPKQAQGNTATVGIRGTGLYLEAEAQRTYVCLCYGSAEIAARDDPSIREQAVSIHHDVPRYVYAAGAGETQRIQRAPLKNHDDLELMLIETLVGRSTPFSLFDEGYGSSRRY